ncbi:MAG: type II toxin-antitoxin system VapC family toxin [Deltaproteobacteria bacterium]|nr:type II toxin-antitoxin system VapC family toxin [Deltaproteobacteria bacterium]
MTGWAMDASLALAWALPDERVDAADAFFRRMAVDDVRVPAVFWYEIANAIAVSARRRRIALADARRLLDVFSRLPVKTDAQIGQPSLVPLGATARAHDLSSYDAAYLELAARRGLGLATLDDRLAAAAKRAGIEVFRPGAR